ncbi:hypothetical protein MHX53_11085 [Brevibacterium sp. ACRRH]|uniref:hypothetical protein n=1 Tax=Brevibacterium sp. ACRRH TaxID=2918183 RepID=UPI001EF54BD7|nr:hypothetical protein [Brevibacterium sp. ACRRH]MCG7299582.1 hypothetical protein [Brevibacterium sp. ACRRH]
MVEGRSEIGVARLRPALGQRPPFLAFGSRAGAGDVDGNGVCVGLDVDGDRGCADDRRNQIAGVAPAGPEFGFTDDSWASVRSAALGACLLEAARVRIASA